MPLTIRYKTLSQYQFDFPFRVFVSGSSQSGKTYFAHKLLQHEVFTSKAKQVVYFHPDYLSTVPVTWHKTLSIPVSYQSGVPSLQELCDLKPFTVVVLDDLYEECVNSSSIDYLFRVLSGKNNLAVIILSQRYFSVGKFGLNIRNNCNYTVLMRNVDSKLNLRIASLLSLKLPIQKAIDHTYEDNFYPYIFVDSTPRGQVSTYRCYIDIFSRVRIVFGHNGMKAYIINEHDFLNNFEILSSNTAVKNGKNEKGQLRGKNRSDTESESGKESSETFARKIQFRAQKLRKRRKFRKNI